MKRRKKTERDKFILANDTLFGQIIRYRDNATCRRSGRKNSIQVSHFHSRGHLRIRWEEDNAMCLNAGVHKFWAHKEAEEFRDFWIKEIGIVRFEELKLKKRYKAPVRLSDLKNWNLYLKNRLKELK